MKGRQTQKGCAKAPSAVAEFGNIGKIADAEIAGGPQTIDLRRDPIATVIARERRRYVARRWRRDEPRFRCPACRFEPDAVVAFRQSLDLDEVALARMGDGATRAALGPVFQRDLPLDLAARCFHRKENAMASLDRDRPRDQACVILTETG